MIAPVPSAVERAASRPAIEPRRALALASVWLAIIAVFFFTRRAGHEWGDDYGMYLMHARNLVAGQPYADTGYVYNTLRPTVGPPTYPPVFPLLAAPVVAIFGPDLAAMKVFEILIGLAFLGLMQWTFAPRLAWYEQAALLAIIGLNPYLVGFKDIVGSDLPFLMLVYLSLGLLDRGLGATSGTKSQWRLLLGGGVAMYLAYGTRSLGIALPMALAATELLHQRRLRKPVLASLAAFAALAAFQTKLLHNDSTYSDQFQFHLGVPLENAAYYFARLGGMWQNGYSRSLSAALFGAMLIAAALGCWNRLRRGMRVYDAFAFLYWLPFLVWPANLGDRRYLLPVLPIFVYYALHGVRVLGRLLRAWSIARRHERTHPPLPGVPWGRRAVLGGFLLALTVSYALRFTTMDFHPVAAGPDRPGSRELFQFVRENTGRDDVLVFTKARALALFAERRCLVYHRTDGRDAAWDEFAQRGATHFIAPRSDDVFGMSEDAARLDDYLDFLAHNAARLDRLYQNQDFDVYRVRARQ